MCADDQVLLEYARWVRKPELPERPAEVQKSYFICGTPRSGTWLLAGLLASTGLAGRPHEYFWRDTRRVNERIWQVSSSAEYLSRVLQAGTTPNGVFACKLAWGYMSDFLEVLRSQHCVNQAGDRELIAHFFPQPRLVWVSRDDSVAQAVSWALAIQTGHWHHWDRANADEPTFDVDQVRTLADEATAHNDAWRHWFRENGIDALAIRFEELIEEPVMVTRDVLALLDIDAPDGLVVSERTVKTADARRDVWIPCYSRIESAGQPRE